jgi:hypothetical protein
MISRLIVVFVTGHPSLLWPRLVVKSAILRCVDKANPVPEIRNVHFIPASKSNVAGGHNGLQTCSYSDPSGGLICLRNC